MKTILSIPHFTFLSFTLLDQITTVTSTQNPTSILTPLSTPTSNDDIHKLVKNLAAQINTQNKDEIIPTKRAPHQEVIDVKALASKILETSSNTTIQDQFLKQSAQFLKLRKQNLNSGKPPTAGFGQVIFLTIFQFILFEGVST